METLLNRYRGLLVLVLVLAAQLVMLGVQVRNQQDVRLVRVWAVSAVTPFATILDSIRTGVVGTIAGYVDLRGAREQNQQLKKQVAELRRQVDFLRAELGTADRADRLLEFRQRIPSRTLPARIIGTNAAPASRVVFIDRGSSDGLLSGMAVLGPEGVVGRVLDVYRNTSQVMLATDPSFAMGVISQRGRVQGTLRGLGQRRCMVDFVENHLNVEKGEWFYSSGDDRVFPRGLPVGPVVAASEGSPFQDISVEPAALAEGLDEVLVVLEAVHQELPAPGPGSVPSLLAPAPPAEVEALPTVSGGPAEGEPVAGENGTAQNAPEKLAGQGAAGGPTGNSNNSRRPPATDADRLLERYRRIGAAQAHPYGGGGVGTPAPDFNRPMPAPGAVTPPAAQNQPQTPASVSPPPR